MDPSPFFPGSGLEKKKNGQFQTRSETLVGRCHNFQKGRGGGGVSLRYTYRSNLMNIYLCCVVQSYADWLTIDAGRIEQQETTEDRCKTSDFKPIRMQVDEHRNSMEKLHS